MEYTPCLQDVNKVFFTAMAAGEGLSNDQLKWVWKQCANLDDPEPGQIAVLVAAAKCLHLETPELLADATHDRVHEDALRIYDKATAVILRLTGGLQ
jgi:hypothetical protein